MEIETQLLDEQIGESACENSVDGCSGKTVGGKNLCRQNNFD